MVRAIKKGNVIKPIVPPSGISLPPGGSEEESKVDQGDGQRGVANAGSGVNPPIVPPITDQNAPAILPPSRIPPPSLNPPQEEVAWVAGQYRRPHSKLEIEAMTEELRIRLFDLMEANNFLETFVIDSLVLMYSINLV